MPAGDADASKALGKWWFTSGLFVTGFGGGESPRIPRGGDQVMDPITAYQVTSFLEGVVLRGTARAHSA